MGNIHEKMLLSDWYPLNKLSDEDRELAIKILKNRKEPNVTVVEADGTEYNYCDLSEDKQLEVRKWMASSLEKTIKNELKRLKNLQKQE